MKLITGTVIKLKNDIPGVKKDTVGIIIKNDVENMVIFPNGEFIEFNEYESEEFLGVIGFAVPISDYKYSSISESFDDYKRGMFGNIFMEYNSNMPIYNSIGNVLIKLIRQNKDYNDYDDENIIQLYKKMTAVEKLAVDNIIVYLSGHTLNEIINLYNNE